MLIYLPWEVDVKPRNIANFVGATTLAGGIILASVASALAPLPVSEVITGGVTGSGYAGMMGGGVDAGAVMGSLWANVPGEKISPLGATSFSGVLPRGAKINPTSDRIAVSEATANFTLLAGPSTLRSDGFEITGLTNPTIAVPTGSQMRIELVNRDGNSAHRLLISTGTATQLWVPMMTAIPYFSGSALRLHGDATSSGMHLGQLGFRANMPGSYRYFCPIPRHAQDGMMDSFTVTA